MVSPMKNAARPEKNVNVMNSPSEKPGSRNRRRLTSGDRPRSCNAASNNTKASSAGAESRRHTIIQAGQPAPLPSTSG